MYFKRQVELSTMYRNMASQKKYDTAEEAIQDIKNGCVVLYLRAGLFVIKVL